MSPAHTAEWDAPLPGGRVVDQRERESREAMERGRDYCPKCGATGRDAECATPSGRDHAARRDYRWGWDSAMRATRVIPPAVGGTS